MSFCTRCGQPVQGTMRFCTTCGAPLAGGEETLATPAAPAATDPPTLTTGVPPAPAADPYPRWSPPPPPGGDLGRGDRGPGPYSDPAAEPYGAEPYGAEPYGAEPYGAEPTGPGRRRIPVWGVIAAVVVVAAAGLGGWYEATHRGHQLAASGQRPASSQPSAGGAGSPAASSPSSQLASPTGAATPSTPAATAAGAGSQVALGPGVSGQTAGAVAAFASRYFAAINRHDFPAYISLFAPGADPGENAQKFQAGYASTTDSTETLVALAGPPSGKTAASLTFNSHQSPASSATHTACTSWRITLYLVPSGTSYLIGRPPASYHASFQPCS